MSAFRARGVTCVWIGSANGLEARRVPEHGIDYHPIATGKLRRYWDWQNVTDLVIHVPTGLAQAWRLLRRVRPSVVLGTGGFVALPVAAAATSLRIPLVVHEQTSVPGLANRIAAKVARRVAISWDASRPYFSSSRTVLTGNPLRPELRLGSREAAIARFGFDPSLPLLYVTGGAQGASSLNRVVGEALERLLEQAQIVHQCGDNRATGDRHWLEERRARLPATRARRYTIIPFVGGELGDLYAATTLLVTRAGAGTLNECCQLGLPAIYVPLPGASGNEQMANARLAERAGGALVLPQPALTPSSLAASVRDLLSDPGRLKEMSERARTLAVPDAAERLADLVLAVRDGHAP